MCIFTDFPKKTTPCWKSTSLFDAPSHSTFGLFTEMKEGNFKSSFNKIDQILSQSSMGELPSKQQVVLTCKIKKNLRTDFVLIFIDVRSTKNQVFIKTRKMRVAFTEGWHYWIKCFNVDQLWLYSGVNLCFYFYSCCIKGDSPFDVF